MIELILLVLVIWVTAHVVASRKEQESTEDITNQLGTDETAIRRQIAGQIREKAATEHDLSRKSAIEETADFVLRGNSYTSDVPSWHYAARYQAEQVALDSPPSTIVSAQDKALTYQQNETKNINTILYVASFLLVGAAILFIGTSLPSTIKFIALCIVASLFYGVGLGLYAVVERLRPAAVAFVGTGLALLPFVGLAFYNYILPDAQLAWFLTSLIGVAALLFATLRLQSQLVAYLSMAFIISLATSSVAVVSVPLIWYFVVLIVVSMILTVLASVAVLRIPAVFAKPIDQTGQLLAPLTLIGSILTPHHLSLLDYQVIFVITAAYYAVSSVRASSIEYVKPYRFIARALIVIAFAITTYDVSDSWAWVGFYLVAAALLSQLYSVYKARDDEYEAGWLVVVYGMIGLALLIWIQDGVLVSYALAAMLVSSVYSVYVVRKAEHAVVGAVSALLLPLSVGALAFEPDLPGWSIALTYLVMAAVALLARAYVLREKWMMVASFAYGSYLAVAVLIGFSEDAGWRAAIMLSAAALWYVTSVVEKSRSLLIVTNVTTAIGLQALVSYWSVPSLWQPLFIAWLSASLWYGLHWYSRSKQHTQRSDIFFGSTMAALLLGAIPTLFADTTMIAAALTVCVAAGILAIEGRVQQRISYYELAIVLITIALQRIVWVAYEPSHLLFSHWWAASIGAMALLRQYYGDHQDVRARVIIALVFFSGFTGLAALDNPQKYQMLFLIEHIILLLVGLMLNSKLTLQWSAISIGLAMIWMLRGYTYILLALLAVGLIGIAVWRLLNKDSSSHT